MINRQSELAKVKVQEAMERVVGIRERNEQEPEYRIRYTDVGQDGFSKEEARSEDSGINKPDVNIDDSALDDPDIGEN